MKKYSIIIILLIGVFFNSCEKKPFDPRNKYVDKYEFTTTVYDYNLQCCNNQNSSCCPQVRQIVYKGSIMLYLSNEIVVEFLPEEEHLLDGKYYNNKRIIDGKLYVVVDDEVPINIYNDGNVEFGFGGNSKAVAGTTGYNVKGKRL